MRHRVAGHQLSRDGEHRLAMRRNMVASLFEHETISTTMEKAREVRAFAEKLITLAKRGTLTARRRAIAALGDRDIIAVEDGVLVKKGTVIGKLFSELGPRYLDRPGGCTRIIRLSLTRLGDNGRLVLLQLVRKDEGSGGKSVGKSKKGSAKGAGKARARRGKNSDGAAKKSQKESSKDMGEKPPKNSGVVREQGSSVAGDGLKKVRHEDKDSNDAPSGGVRAE